MKKMLGILVAGAMATPALASNLNVTVKSGGSSTVNVAPGATVNFTVEGILSDTLNEGLALVGFDLHFTGGALPANTVVEPAGAISCGNPMPAFVKPDGITNPVGYKGTLIGGDLVQVGGGQNTIKNSVDNPACAPNCAPFPVGTPILGVAQPGVCGNAVIATGSFAAPMTPGSYQLQVINGFANVIKDGEVLANAFLATEAAGVNVSANLQVNVQEPTGCPGYLSTVPSNCSVDARRPHMPAPNQGTLQGYNSIALNFDHACSLTGVSPSSFTVACFPAGAPCPTISTANAVDHTVTVTLSSVIPAGKWTCITHTASGDQACIGSLPGDADGNLTTLPTDILAIIDNLNGILVPALTPDHCDLDRSGQCLPADIITEIDMLNGANGFIVWNGKTLAACPSP